MTYSRTDAPADAYRKGLELGRLDAGVLRRPVPRTYSGKALQAWREGYRDGGGRPAVEPT